MFFFVKFKNYKINLFTEMRNKKFQEKFQEKFQRKNIYNGKFEPDLITSRSEQRTTLPHYR
jgi:hypothetical protein